MGHFKVLIMALTILIGNGFFADLELLSTANENAATYEVVELLENNDLFLEKEIKAEVRFSIDADRKITVHAVTTTNKVVKKYILEKLQDQKLLHKQWEIGKYYCLPVKIEPLF